MLQTLWISTGASRKEMNWKNVELSWPDLVKKFSQPVITGETLSEFKKLKIDIQSERKDVGAFIGGPVVGGRRKKDAIVQRYVMVLDIDRGKLDFWDIFCMLYENAAAIYGTRNHSATTPRYRLVLPLLRPVGPDEFEAMARKVAGILNMEIFDPTTFQVERLMYWPSISTDQEFYFRQQDGPWLDPDKVLNSYADWRDQSQWPRHSKEEGSPEKIAAGIKKQGDPASKPAFIGAFNRIYGIGECIETFLKDEYEEVLGSEGSRFTYLKGSTAGGLVVYEDKFAYSHHGTDPASGKLCSSFDLVRLHKYGLMDSEASDHTNIGKLPSTQAMIDFARDRPEVRAELHREQAQGARGMFAEDDDQAAGTTGTTGAAVEVLEDESWKEGLDMNKAGKLLTTHNNLLLILTNDPKLRGRIRFNELTLRVEVSSRLPWDRKRKYPRGWTDDDWSQLRVYIGVAPYELLRTPKLEDCMAIIRENNRYHPIREYLEGLTWDGGKRLDHILEDYMGCESSEYIQAITRKTLLAAVARVMTPGIKYDYILTLVGKQGIGKSTLIRKLSKGWFSDTFNFNMLKGKEAIEQIQGKWIIEIGEMAGLRKAEVESAKSFISSQEDTYRPAYGRESVVLPRGNIFIGSSNNREFLRKVHGGNRRFFPADCGEGAVVKSLWKDLGSLEVDQIWAEAVEAWQAGEELELSPEMVLEARKVQEAHEESNDMFGIIQNFLEELLPENWDEKTTSERASYFWAKDEMSAAGRNKRTMISAPEIWVECLKKPKGDLSHANTKIIHDIMREMPGWFEAKSKVYFPEYGKLIGYIRGSGENASGATKRGRGSDEALGLI